MSREEGQVPRAGERSYVAGGLAAGTVLGLLMGAAFVGVTSDWSWLAFTLTLGWALGLGIAVDAMRERETARRKNDTP